MLKRMKEHLKRTFKTFLKMDFTKKFFITYLGCWISFLSVSMLSKVVVFLSSFLTPSNPEGAIKTVEYVASKKFEVVSSSISSHVDHSYLSLVLTYFLNNSISCLVILLVYILTAYLYRREVKEDPKALEDYIDALMLIYIVTVVNPLTGILGYRLDIEHLVVIVPHGIFEFAGLALSIVTGLTLAERILPLECPQSSKGIFTGDIILKIIVALMLIGFAALLEPLDWMIYQYSLYYGEDLLELLVKTYLGILKFLPYSVLPVGLFQHLYNR